MYTLLYIIDVFQRSASVCELSASPALECGSLCRSGRRGWQWRRRPFVYASARRGQEITCCCRRIPSDFTGAQSERASQRETETADGDGQGVSRPPCVPVGFSNADRDGRRRYNNTARARSFPTGTRDPTRRYCCTTTATTIATTTTAATDDHVNGFIILYYTLSTPPQPS